MSIRKSSYRFAIAIVVIIAISAVSYASPWTTALEFLGLTEVATQEAPESAPAPVRTQWTANGQSMMAPLIGTYNIPGDYADLAAAIADLNAQGVGGAVTLNVIAGNPQTSPANPTTTGGGYIIGGTGSLVLSTTSAVNTVTIQGNGNTVTAPTTHVVGQLNDGIFKIIGGDWITITGFTMLENPANVVTTAASNTMTEWGVALLYVTTTDGAQNNTITGNTIDLNRTYQNTFGIYSNSTHTNTSVTSSATATGAAGSNAPLTITANTITDVNFGIMVIGPTAAADHNDGLTIGGTAPNANNITNYGTTNSFSGYVNIGTTGVSGIWVRNTKNYNISFNSITSSSGATGITASTTVRGIYIPSASNQPTGTFVNNINSNSIAITPHLTTSAINAISVETTTSSPTSTTNINSNNFTTLNHSIASPTGAIIGIIQSGSATAGPLNHSISSNTFTNLTAATTGSFTFISNSWTRPTSGVGNVDNNSIVTAFNKTGAGGTVTLYTSNSTSGATIQEINNNNNFSNITVTGATTIAGWRSTDGGSPIKTVTGNTFSNWTGGTNQLTGLAVSFAGSATVSGNLVSNLNCACVIVGMETASGNQVWSQNTVHTLSGTGTGAVTGILNSGGTTQTLMRNKVYGIENTNAGGSASGITVSAGTTVNLQNNLVGLVSAPAANSDNSVRGINITSTTTLSNVNVYYNSIYLNASTGGTNFGSSGVFHTGSATATTARLDLRNNVIVNTSFRNGTGATAALWRTGSSVFANFATTSNNNLLYAGTPGPTNLLYYDGANTMQTIGAYKTLVSPRDSASISENPPFLSTTGSSVDFLHINTVTPTQIESGGAPVAGITDDFDGNTRNVTTPDIGADEFTGTGLDLSPPTVTYTALANTASLGNRVLSTSITDATGVPTAGIGLPVLYWKINAGAYTPVTATYVSGSQYDFTFGAGVVATDVVSYYIVAQDTAGTPNVGSTPGGGSGFTINPPAAATPPGSPSTYTIVPSISGTKTVGAGGDYTTLTAAIAAINAAEVTGPVVLSLTDASYTTPAETFPLVLNANGGSNATNTITIVPASGNVTSITGAAASGCLIRLNGADYVTIDGSNSGGTDRSLTLTNTSTTSPATVCISSLGTGAGATNDTIKNTNIATGSNAATSYGIWAGSATIGTAGDDNDNLTIQNNSISKAYYGIRADAGATGLNNTLVITGNSIGSATATNEVLYRGISLSQATGASVSNNTVFNMLLTTAFNPAAIEIGTGVVSSTFNANIITEIAALNTGGYGGRGFTINTGNASSSLTLSNNSISNVRGSGWNSFTSDVIAGILIGNSASTTGGVNLYYNSVNLGSGTFAGNSSGTLSAALAVAQSGATNLDVRNNVFATNLVNSGAAAAKSYAIYSAAANTAFTNINFNDYYVSGTQGVLGFIGSDRVDLAAIQAGFGQNASSINANPLFNTATNLQPGSGSPLLLAGTPIGGITTDILGVTRNVTTPTIGAYETIADVGGPTISYTPLPNTTSTSDTAIVASITDPSGVPTSGTLRPRVYFKRSVDASYVSRVCTYSAPNYNCGLLYAALPGAPVAGDTIQYFVIAQDNIGNVSSSPSGVVATNVNTVTTPPTPNAYNILLEINTYPYSQNFESGAGGYTTAIVGGSVNDWILGTPAKTSLSAAHSGTNAWVTKLTGPYSSSHNAAVVSPIFNFTSVASTATISFWQNFDISADPDWDSMVLEASTDGGTVWNRVDSTLGTGPTFDTANSTGWYNLSGVNGPITGPEWTNSSTAYAGHSIGWIQSTTKVGALAGQASVMLRWRFASDSSFTDEGFAIDDIAVTPLVVAPGNLQLSSSTYSGNENTTVNIDVNRVSGSSGTVGVTATLADVSATGGAACTAGVDYINPGPQNLTFVDSDILETISVSLCPDASIESAETFTVTLSSPTGGAGLGSPTAATVTINDVPPPLAGTYNVPGDYPSLTNPGGIFEALNNSGASAAITINIAADLTGETGTVALNQIAGGYSVLIKPTGSARTITSTAAANGLITLFGADNVTVDGSLGGGTDQSLTLFNQNSTGSGTSVFSIISLGAGSGGTGNTLKNTVVRNGTNFNSTDASFNFCIFVGGNGVAAGPDNDNTTIENNSIERCQFALQAVGATGGVLDGLVIRNNVIGGASTADAFGLYGMSLGSATGAVVEGNTIRNAVYSADQDVVGILAASGFVNSSIVRNNITNLEASSANGYGANGLYIATGNAASNLTIANNFISAIDGTGWSTGFLGDTVAGIRIAGTGTGGINLWQNSVNLTGTYAGSTNATVSAALMVTATTPTALNVRNNILVNTFDNTAGSGDKSYAIYTNSANTMFSSINFNDYLVSGAAPGVLGAINSVDAATLGALSTATGGDGNSLSTDPQFLSATDLHLSNPSNPVVDAGAGLAVTVDFDNDPRGAHDIGADEIVKPNGGPIPAGTYYNAKLGSGETIGGDVTITNRLYLTGVTVLGTNLLTIGCNATVVGAGPTAFVDGSVKKDYCAPGVFSYPVGTGADYSGVDVNVTTVATVPSSLTVKAHDAFLSGFDPLESISRNWQLDETGDLTADLLFNYVDADVNGNEADYRVWRREGNGTNTNMCSGGPCVNTGLNTLGPVNGVTTFSRWTGSKPLGPTAAEVSVSGRVTTSNGAGIKNAAIVITGNSLPMPKIAKTGSLGYYTVEGLQAGETYVVTVVSKRFIFQVPSRVVSLTDSVTDIDFVANPDQ